MRMAYLCTDPGVPVFGSKGCSLHVQEIIRAFKRIGLDISLFARTLGGCPPDDLGDIALTTLRRLPNSDTPTRERGALTANAETARLIHDAGGFEIAYERYALWSHAGIAAARAGGATTVLEVNAPLIDEQAHYRFLHDKDGALKASLKAFAAADLIVAVSREVADYLNRYSQTHGKVHVIPNGVDVLRFDGTPEARRQNAHPYTVGFLGTLKPWHGVDVLIDAFCRMLAHVPEAELLIVGDGPERSRLEEKCERLGISTQTTFTGAVIPRHVPSLLSRMDVGVAPYPDLSGFYFSPLKVFEYLASGMPAVASDIGQLKDILGTGDAGLLCEPGDPDALSDALCALYGQPDRRHAMGLAGRAQVFADHTWQSVALRILNLATFPTGANDQRSMNG